MHLPPRSILMLLLLVFGGVGLTGCTNDRLKNERDALYQQNQELQDELNRARSALGTADADRNALQRQLEMIDNTAPAPVYAPARANTGFDAITGVTTTTTANTIAVRVPGDVLFSSGKVTLKSSAKKTLNQIAQVIKSDYPAKEIRVEGYTDSDPIRKSGWKDNLELSLQRAAAVERYLATQSLDADLLYSAGFGASKAQGSKAKSRRVEIVVVLHE